VTADLAVIAGEEILRQAQTGRISGHVWINLAPKETAHGRIALAAMVIAASETQLGPVQVVTLLGEILTANEISVTATLSMANINRGGVAAMDESTTNGIGPDVGKMATASARPIEFAAIGAATGTGTIFPSTAVGKAATGTATMTTGTTGAIGIIGTVTVRGIGGAGPQLPC
jgi:hypothetical protein